MASHPEWDAHVAENGQTYYHNPTTGETSWELPTEQPQAVQDSIYTTSTEGRYGDGTLAAEGECYNAQGGQPATNGEINGVHSYYPDVRGEYLPPHQGSHHLTEDSGHSNGEHHAGGYAGGEHMDVAVSVGGSPNVTDSSPHAEYYDAGYAVSDVPQEAATTVEEPISTWESFWDQDRQQYYYHNRSSGQTQWDDPHSTVAVPSASSPAEHSGQTNQAAYLHVDAGPAEQPCLPPEHSHHTMDAYHTRDGDMRDTEVRGAQWGNGHEHLSQPADKCTSFFLPGGQVETYHQPTPMHAAGAAAAKSRPRRIGTASPPTEREGATLKSALSRKRESLRRLEKARQAAAEARARAAAEAESRREARLAAKLATKDKASVCSATAAAAAAQGTTVLERDGSSTPPTDKDVDRSDTVTAFRDVAKSGDCGPSTEIRDSFFPLAGDTTAPGQSDRGSFGDGVLSEGAGSIMLDSQTSLQLHAPQTTSYGLESVQTSSSMQTEYEGEYVGDAAADGEQQEGGSAEGVGRRNLVDTVEHFDVSKNAPHGREVEEAAALSSLQTAWDGVNYDTRTGATVDTEECAEATSNVHQHPEVLEDEQKLGTREAHHYANRHSEVNEDDLPSMSMITPGERLRAPPRPPSPETMPIVLIPQSAAGGRDGPDSGCSAHGTEEEGDEASAIWEEVALFSLEADDEVMRLLGRDPGTPEDSSKGCPRPLFAETDATTAEDTTTVDNRDDVGDVTDADENLLAGERQHGRDSSEVEACAETGEKTVLDAPSDGSGRGEPCAVKGPRVGSCSPESGDSGHVSPPKDSDQASSPATLLEAALLAGESEVLSSQGEDGEASVSVFLQRATARISRLLELLEVARDEDALAVLVGEEEHRACKRVADYAAAGSRFYVGFCASAEYLPACERSFLGKSGSGTASGPHTDLYISGGRRLCRLAFGCLALLGQLDPDVWVVLAGSELGQACEEAGTSDATQDGRTRLTRLLSVSSKLASEESRQESIVSDDEGFNGMEGRADEGDGDGSESTAQMALVVVYEALAGCRRAGVDNVREWSGMGELIETLMDVIVRGNEGSYMQATKALLAANDPCFRTAVTAVDTYSPASLGYTDSPPSNPSGGDRVEHTETRLSPGSQPSVILPLLLSHPARHEVQGALLHVLNEEGYPNGDPELTEMCLHFCADAFDAETDDALFYINDVKVMVDVIVRELLNLPEDHKLRADYVHCLHRLVENSEWATRGDRYREDDLEQALGHRFRQSALEAASTSPPDLDGGYS